MSEKTRLWKEPQVYQIVQFALTRGGQMVPENTAWRQVVEDKTRLQARNFFKNLAPDLKQNRNRWENGLTDHEVVLVMHSLYELSLRSDTASNKLREFGVDSCFVESARTFLSDPSFPSQLRDFSQTISRRR